MNKKSVFHIRIDSPGYNCDYMENAFKASGYEYFGLKWQEFRFEHGIEKLRSQVIKTAEILKPQIIFCHLQNPEVFSLETFKELSKHGAVINYTFDVRDEEGIKWMYDVAPHIKHTFFACMEDVWSCIRKGIYNIGHLHSSVDMEVFEPQKKGGHYAFDISFCGNRYDNTNLKFPQAIERQEMISFLKDRHKQKFQCYGLGQEGGLIRPEVEANVYNFSRIAISQSNFILNDYSSDRIWRIMASGTLCMAKYFPGIEKVFKNATNIIWWHTFDELAGFIDYYLSNEEKRLAVAEAGCELVRQNHSWINRIHKIENII